jgi:hypothetical protein
LRRARNLVHSSVSARPGIARDLADFFLNFAGDVSHCPFDAILFHNQYSCCRRAGGRPNDADGNDRRPGAYSAASACSLSQSRIPLPMMFSFK